MVKGGEPFLRRCVALPYPAINSSDKNAALRLLRQRAGDLQVRNKTLFPEPDFGRLCSYEGFCYSERARRGGKRKKGRLVHLFQDAEWDETVCTVARETAGREDSWRLLTHKPCVFIHSASLLRPQESLQERLPDTQVIFQLSTTEPEETADSSSCCRNNFTLREL